MNVDIIEATCRRVTRAHFEYFKECVINPLFELNKPFVSQCVDHMLTDIGMDIYKKHHDETSMSGPQRAYLERMVNGYKKTAETVAWRFGNKKLSEH